MRRKTSQQVQRETTETIWHRLQTIIRRRRFRFVERLLATLPPRYTLLDVGGTPDFWLKMGRPATGNIILYNLDPLVKTPIPGTNIKTLVGDGRDMHEFANQQFDVVFSNSVIEHAGNYQQQEQMAREIQRVGQRYCVQTPNRYFPIEPHVLLPLFQFLPRYVQIYILIHFRTPWGWKIGNRRQAQEYVHGIRLLTEHELRLLFPGAHIYKERFCGLTKSFTVYHGW